jgi:hypothetical protein
MLVSLLMGGVEVDSEVAHALGSVITVEPDFFPAFLTAAAMTASTVGPDTIFTFLTEVVAAASTFDLTLLLPLLVVVVPTEADGPTPAPSPSWLAAVVKSSGIQLIHWINGSSSLKIDAS